jgi:hypothetical protein
MSNRTSCIKGKQPGAIGNMLDLPHVLFYAALLKMASAPPVGVEPLSSTQPLIAIATLRSIDDKEDYYG